MSPFLPPGSVGAGDESLASARDRRQLTRTPVRLPNAVGLLEELPPRELADELVALAEHAAGCAVALYLPDIGGSALHYVAGDRRWPVQIPIVQALGPELPRGRMSDAQATVAHHLDGACAVPLWLHGRAVGVLITEDEPADALEPVTRQAAAALELGDRYTDVLKRARRLRTTSAAAEIQENLLPPRIAEVHGADLAAGIVPAYDVGGDWYDYADNPEGVWLAVADAVGKGPLAAGASTMALGALRAARRADLTLTEAALAMDETVRHLRETDAFVTAVLAMWLPATSTLQWLRFGHPYPLLVTGDGRVTQLHGGRRLPPLGLLVDDDLQPETVTLRPGDRLILVSDGVFERRLDKGGFFGEAGIVDAIRSAADTSAAATANALTREVVEAASTALVDDATVMVLAPCDTDTAAQ